MIHIPDAPSPTPPKPIVTGGNSFEMAESQLSSFFLVLEPTPLSPRSLTVNVDLYPQPRTESLAANELSDVMPIKTKINTPQAHVKKRRKQPRKRTQSKQRSAMDEISEREEQIDDIGEDEDHGEDNEVY